MQPAKQESDHVYDEKDALVTLIVEIEDLDEATARALVEKLLSKRPKKAIRNFLLYLRMSLAVVPPPARREIIVKAARKVKQQIGTIERVKQQMSHPALAGSLLLRFAGMFYAPEKMETIFIPLVSDYVLQMQATPHGTARRVVLRLQHYHAFARAMGLDECFTWMDRIIKLVKILLFLFK